MPPWNDPEDTIKLLDWLEEKKFSDDAFWRVHHFRDRKPTIEHHRAYCEKLSKKHGRFLLDRENSFVQRRLQMVLNEYESNPQSKPSDFIRLAEDAWKKLQPPA